MRHAQRVHGFTLIELLVVIGIIAVLAGILFPVFAKARESARTSRCMNNQRQVVMAINIWVQDHDDVYPDANAVWQELTEPPQLFICPTVGPQQRNGYVYNANLSGLPLGDTLLSGNESHFIVTADGSTADHVAYRRRDVDLRHHENAIASFVDGHVQRVTYSELTKYHIGNLVFKPVPFTSNSRYTVVIKPEGTTITRIGDPADIDWGYHIMSDPITDIPAGSYCRLEFTVATPQNPFGCGFSHNPPNLCHGYTDTWPSDNSRIDIYEEPGLHITTLATRYNTRDLYAIERLADGTVNYLINDTIVYISKQKLTDAPQFHFNGYYIGTEIRNLRYCVED